MKGANYEVAGFMTDNGQPDLFGATPCGARSGAPCFHDPTSVCECRHVEHDATVAHKCKRCGFVFVVGSLDAPGAARRTDRETSHQAARLPRRGQKLRILRHLAVSPSRTADELDAELQWRETTAGRRLPELERLGFVVCVHSTFRETRRGVSANPYAITNAGRAFLETLNTPQAVTT